MSELRVNFDSPAVAYTTAAVGGAAVGSLVPSAAKFIKKGIDGTKADSFIRSAADTAVNFKNGAVTRLKNAFNALFEIKPLAEGQKPSAIREFAGACKKFGGQVLDWCKAKAQPITSRPMAKWAVIGGLMAMVGLFAYNKIAKND